ncbi:MAG: four helix bundle protein [Limisphaerales bacterium]
MKSAFSPNLNHNRNPNTMTACFDHEKLEVYQESLAFVAWLEPLLQKLPKSIAVRDQLDRASTSIVLNLAEGNGKYTSPDRCRFFDISRGSALECAAALDVLVSQNRCEAALIVSGKERLRGIVSMLVGLIKANSGYRLHEGD